MNTVLPNSEIAILSFSAAGETTAGRIAASLGRSVRSTRVGRGGLAKAVSSAWASGPAAVVFVSSVGIAVRAVAPLIQKKTIAPAVIAVDEKARFAVSVLSGHLGGANRLTRRIAGALGASAVITTATDSSGIFSVDEWAAAMGMKIENPEAIVAVSSAILAGEEVGLFSSVEISGSPPFAFSPGVARASNILIGPAPEGLALERDSCLVLTPRPLRLGIGCKRGATASQIASAAEEALTAAGLTLSMASEAASIDIKAGEEGLLEFCRNLSLGFSVYSAEELMAVEYPGLYSSSFVLASTGADNVCERAALASAGPGGRLAARRHALGPVTCAAAITQRGYSFEYQDGWH